MTESDLIDKFEESLKRQIRETFGREPKLDNLSCIPYITIKKAIERLNEQSKA